MSLDPLDTVRIGIVGPSWWVDYWHMPACRNHPNAKIVAICGERSRDAEEVHAKYGPSAQYYTNLEAMLATPDLDGIIVCTPNDMHFPATMAALTRDLHVTCEKPVALDATQALTMAETARERRLLVMTNFPYRGNPAAVRMRNLIAEGLIGKPLHVYGSYHGGFGLGGRPGWRGSWSRSGAGILGDLGSHLIDLARYVLTDEFTAVCGHGITLLRGEDKEADPEIVPAGDPLAEDRNDDSFTFLSEFARGTQGIFHTSWVAYQGAGTQHQEVEVYGTRGRLRFLATHKGTLLQVLLVGTPHWVTLEVPGTERPDQTAEEDEDYFRPGRHTPQNTTYRWIEAIRTGETFIEPSLDDGWRAQQVIDAVLRSNRARCWETVE
jgi:predicted dehydrogenase